MSSSSSREYSPDWLRSSSQAAGAASTSIWTLSSSSSSSDDDKLPIGSVIGKSSTNQQHHPPKDYKTSFWDLPSDSEDSQHPKLEEHDDDAEQTSLKPESSNKLDGTLPTAVTKGKTKQKTVTQQENDDDVDDDKKPAGHHISSSRLPLLLTDKVQRSKVLVECEGESIDLSGDLGSVGRVVISDSPSGNQDMLFDLKGTIYKTTIVPSRTFCVVSFGQSEAKIEAIMNDFIQLKPQSNVYEAETMVEGTLEGFLFDSEDEGDKQQHANRQADENEGGEPPQPNGKGRGKSDASKKKAKTAVRKPAAKKVNTKKKAPAAKKTKAKK